MLKVPILQGFNKYISATLLNTISRNVAKKTVKAPDFSNNFALYRGTK